MDELERNLVDVEMMLNSEYFDFVEELLLV
jgi:hypothetical protein